MKTSVKRIIYIALIALMVAVVLTAVVVVSLYYGTNKSVYDYFEKPITKLPAGTLLEIERSESYFAHPDMLMTESGRLIIAYPSGHGKGPIIMKTSDDFGDSWSERLTDIPTSWQNSQETPTLYNLHFTDGTSKLLLVSGCPRWPGGIKANGFNFSISTDDGASWSEFENAYSPADCIVAMSSLTQVKENGAFVDKWLATYHTREFVIYKTYLTFDEQGKAHWSEPEALMPENRRISRSANLCEAEIIRGHGEHEDTLIMLMRANARKTNSMICVSRDEGASWTKPVELPYILTGDRHKAEYDEQTGRYFVSYRSLLPYTSNALKPKSWLTAGWVGWIGTFDDLLSLSDTDETNDRLGDAFLELGFDYQGGDNGYSGVVIKEGEVSAVSYGCFAADARLPYIAGIKLRIADYVK